MPEEFPGEALGGPRGPARGYPIAHLISWPVPAAGIARECQPPFAASVVGAVTVAEGLSIQLHGGRRPEAERRSSCEVAANYKN
eukprot:7358210-Pyramimonas_sp.AAC.1